MKKLLLFLLPGIFSFGVAAKENIQGNAHKKPLQISATGCVQGTATVDLDISNVRARILQSGDMWWDQSAGLPQYEVPKNSGKHSMYAGSLWIGGIDAGGQIKVAAQTYRQTGNDYWPGPLDTTNADITAGQCLAYDQFWKISKQDVINFVNNGTTTPEILSWPGNGNASFHETHFLAPFFDNNADGIYNTNDGDYPYYNLSGSATNCNNILHGDQTIWWVFNDAGDIKTQTDSPPIGLEIQGQAFAFITANDAIKNSTFYQYKIINRSSTTLNQTYFGHWADPDLGYYKDDYVGCDVNRGMGYGYNGDAIDDPPDGYGTNPPAVGIDFLQGPLADPGDGIDNDRDGTTDEPGEQIIMSNFIYFNNNNDPIQGNPDSFPDFYNYLKGSWLNGTQMTYGGDGYNVGSTNFCSFMFPDTTDILYYSTLGAWTEVTAGNVPDDRRFLQSAGAFTLQPGAVNFITVGVVWARDTIGGASIDALKSADDVIQQLYDSCFGLAISVSELAADNSKIIISPNPFSDQTVIDFYNLKNETFTFTLYDIKGKTVREMEVIKSNRIVLKKENLESGVYFFKLKNNNDKFYSGKLIIQ